MKTAAEEIRYPAGSDQITYHKAAAAESWRMLLAFFKENL